MLQFNPLYFSFLSLCPLYIIVLNFSSAVVKWQASVQDCFDNLLRLLSVVPWHLIFKNLQLQNKLFDANTHNTIALHASVWQDFATICVFWLCQCRQSPFLKTSPHNNESLVSLLFFLLCQDFLYHGIAAFFYLSASVALAKVTLDLSGKQGNNTTTELRNYKLDVSAVVSQAVHRVVTCCYLGDTKKWMIIKLIK